MAPGAVFKTGSRVSANISALMSNAQQQQYQTVPGPVRKNTNYTPVPTTTNTATTTASTTSTGTLYVSYFI